MAEFDLILDIQYLLVLDLVLVVQDQLVFDVVVEVVVLKLLVLVEQEEINKQDDLYYDLELCLKTGGCEFPNVLSEFRKNWLVTRNAYTKRCLP